MVCAKRKYDRDMFIDNCLEFYDLKSNKRYTFLMNFNIKLQFSSQKCKFKVIYTFTKSVYAICFYNFHVNYITTQFKTSKNIRRNYFLSSINLDREKQMSPALIILNCHISEKTIREKMEVLRIFGSWDQEIDS